METLNKQRRNFISLSELEYSPLEFKFRRVRIHLSKYVSRNNCREDWKNANSLFKRRSRCRRFVGSTIGYKSIVANMDAYSHYSQNELDHRDTAAPVSPLSMFYSCWRNNDLLFFFSFQQLAVPRPDEWSRFQNTVHEIQANASSNIGEIGSPKMSPSKIPFS